MQTVTLGASHLQVTPITYETWQFGGDWEVLPAETVQPPYHLFRRDIEAGLLPYARAQHIGVLAYGPLARGLLGGTITGTTTFGGVAALYPGLP